MSDSDLQIPIAGALSDAEPASSARAKVKRKVQASGQTSETLLADICRKLDRIVAVLAAQGKDKERQVAILVAAGCDSVFIASVLGVTPQRVRQMAAWRQAQGGALIDGATGE
jgi:hypothetical protein